MARVAALTETHCPPPNQACLANRSLCRTKKKKRNSTAGLSRCSVYLETRELPAQARELLEDTCVASPSYGQTRFLDVLPKTQEVHSGFRSSETLLHVSAFLRSHSSASKSLTRAQRGFILR
ncbi:uncharacterized protein CIMG_13465 [Coccidioides immitis RS]|uniref:Uncharacterized protein n=1 Tax=Coccidioides immitis (strain RS) TaxID=246410 RepID=A0A0D8JV36_COCIM|nr:uncharacterized protein CIMG_13465 [Coccidioides immitis RS]KJF61157.1 hypothetical protein CIMG_13465 [Coccidioides immitis RS]